MTAASRPGRILVLNGAPRSGKSTLVALVREKLPGRWINLGVDMHMERMLPPQLLPGIGLRPGGERPDLEPLLPPLYGALYESIAAHSRAGFDVVVDIAHHDAYSRPLGILPDCARRLAGLPVLFVGLRCALPEIMARRNASDPARGYATATAEVPVPPPVLKWQEAVHAHGHYDLELDTGALAPEACLAAIAAALAHPPARPTAFERLAAV
ncbi:chloramphenicol phosphotransferase [Kaistia geumhonensis]|uniref:Chloramphenicol 3-O phosphotransferase n=1 Tax=Kaistia geumhonensis TaxID=410839 RepID=A0ABU0M4D6_9HYPH|nr:chloramphenicol phosphotransferase [Kaistia geumhonensis]MCX5478970.1 chloramphenicol phosphotransferase [Kaistia geumhonensis]MDQ0515811.1 chloramphenicol 3-O phosphotransferase [Kaistia geumhonensis]